MSKRTVYILIFIIIIIFTLVQELGFRRYLYTIHFTPSFVAGSLPNFTSILIFAFGFMAIKSPTQKAEPFKFIIGIVAGSILYEFVQIWMPNRVFDMNDIIASIIGGMFSFAIIYILERYFKLKSLLLTDKI